MSRRLLLRGLGGAAVAAPFLGSIGERRARAFGLPRPTTPRRLIVMFTHYGCLTTRWFPQKSHGTLTADDYADTTLEPLAPYAPKLLVPRGIRSMNEWTVGASLGQGNDPHLQVVGSYFTCAPVTPHEPDPFSFETATKFEAMPTGPSLDHVCAAQLSPSGQPLLFRVGGQSESPQSAISYSAAETPYEGTGTVASFVASVSGLFADGQAPSPDTYAAMRGKSVLDLVRDDLATLERFDMSASDRRKLTAWKELLASTVTSAVPACSVELKRQLGLTEENLVPTSSFGTSITDMVTDTLDQADLYSNAAALAALCDWERVIFLKYPSNYVFSGLGLSSESDSLSHRTGNASMGGNCLEDINDQIALIDRYYAEKFAHLVGTLDALEEGDGTLLDNTATVWFQQHSDGCAMNQNNLPILQAGGCGGYFKTGQAVNVFDGSADLTRGNSEAPCIPDNASFEAEDIKRFGTPPEIANAPINKYFCNLMNATGVRADADGYPRVGGSEEVTRYGVYDSALDFISGGENPPTITDPGEFSDLKANG